jgi:predicted metalloprotease with PDZ domain
MLPLLYNCRVVSKWSVGVLAYIAVVKSFVLFILFYIVWLDPSFSIGQVSPKQSVRASLFLDRVLMDKVPVSVEMKGFTDDTIWYRLPKIVPGTYAIYDFGRFVSDFSALDVQGKPLKTSAIDVNTWEIVGAKKLDKITYKIDDTWDAPREEPIVFFPAGTNHEAGKHFLLNLHGYIGYVEAHTLIPYEVCIHKSSLLHGSSAHNAVYADSGLNVFQYSNYHQLVDAPIMYALPDTTLLQVAGAEILVSVYDGTGKINSAFVANQVKQTLLAQKSYLKDSLPIRRYAFLMSFFDENLDQDSYGALEHTTSSVYYMPSLDSQTLGPELRSIAAHEFFHIVTPLTLKSEEIAFFDYNQPVMSKHLWLYEGVVEYFAHHVQAQYGLSDPETFLDEITEKRYVADGYNDLLPITEMSKNCLTLYPGEYDNVYYKGALIAMCLDLKLRKLSKHSINLRDLVLTLSKMYGEEKPFKDQFLFDTIVAMTFPEIKSFIDQYIEGAEPLPLKEYLGYAGIEYLNDVVQKELTLGGIQLGIAQDLMRLRITSVSELDEFGKAMGYRERDVLLNIQGKKITAMNYEEVFESTLYKLKEGDKLRITVARKDALGKYRKKRLSARMIFVEVKRKHLIQPMKNPSAEQSIFYEKWFNP